MVQFWPVFIKRHSYDDLVRMPVLAHSTDGTELRLKTNSGLHYWLHPHGWVEVWVFLPLTKNWKKMYSYNSLKVREKEYEVMENFFPKKKGDTTRAKKLLSKK